VAPMRRLTYRRYMDTKAKAVREAVAWFKRLGSPGVTLADLRSFREWRRNPINSRTYVALTEVWLASLEGAQTRPTLH
jgi:ferric-dicitrate binding protein FerR (iron transport regulator)